MPYCSALTNHACASVNRSWLPCCRFIDAPFVDLHDTSFHEYRDGEFYQSVVKDMETGWHSGCRKCKQEEETGAISLRRLYNSISIEDKGTVDMLELSLSNHCNLACRMCSPAYSTKWQKVIDENPEIAPFQYVNDSGVDIDKVLVGIDTKKLRWIKYLGGEPFITPELKVLIDRLDAEGILGNLQFWCHSNATLFPEKWLDSLARFKLINLKFSIDGIGTTGDYIRQGKDWDGIHSNILKWKQCGLPNLKLGAYATVQAYNIHHVGEIETYANDNGLIYSSAVMVEPRRLSINVLPPEYIDQIRSPSNEVHLKQYKHNPTKWNEFIAYTKVCDKAFGRSMEDVNPLLWSFMTNAS
jgi:sulfatase maturation enzyme AslB (radical SAM superfamily)